MGLVGCRLEYSQPLALPCGLARAAAAGRYAAHYTEKYVLMPDSFFPTDFRQTCAGLSPKGLRALPSARRLQLQPLLAAFRLFATFIPLFAEVVRFLRIVAE